MALPLQTSQLQHNLKSFQHILWGGQPMASKVPPVVKIFLFRALVIFVSWQLLYHAVLAPARVPDRALSNITAMATSRLLRVFYEHSRAIPIKDDAMDGGALVYVNGHRTLGILDACNALDIYVLYLAFLFCFAGHWGRKIAFVFIGIPYIFVINVIRCAAIAWLNLSHKEYVDVTHHYVFTGLVYLLVFYLWMLFTKKLYAHEKQAI